MDNVDVQKWFVNRAPSSGCSCKTTSNRVLSVADPPMLKSVNALDGNPL